MMDQMIWDGQLGPSVAKIQPVKAVTGSKFVKNQPKIDNMYKRVPLKRPSFKLEGEKSDSLQPSKPVWDQVAGAAAILE